MVGLTDCRLATGATKTASTITLSARLTAAAHAPVQFLPTR